MLCALTIWCVKLLWIMRITSNVMDRYSLRQNSVVRLVCEKSKKKRNIQNSIESLCKLKFLLEFIVASNVRTHIHTLVDHSHPKTWSVVRHLVTLRFHAYQLFYFQFIFTCPLFQHRATNTNTLLIAQQKNQKHELYVYVVYFCSPGWPLLITCVYGWACTCLHCTPLMIVVIVLRRALTWNVCRYVFSTQLVFSIQSDM